MMKKRSKSDRAVSKNSTAGVRRKRFVIGLVVLACVAVTAFAVLVILPVSSHPIPIARADQTAASPDTGWKVGMLRANGLRIIPHGRSDASHVLNPEQFSQPAVRHAYWIATQIPATLNQLYCWCGCENRGVHRSNLQCFEDQMAVSCDVCRGTAEIAYSMVQKGITDAAKIQAAVDAKWAPKQTPRRSG